MSQPELLSDSNRIEQRIKEVYSIYKRLPSIAIFLNESRDIRNFVETLENCDFVTDTAIEVVDGSSGMLLAISNQIRVYPINVVKGMEFDVVFFHNIDNSSENADLIKRYIYVGVSRAAFFLGATFNNDNKEISKYFELGKDWKTISERKDIQPVTPNEQPTPLTEVKEFHNEVAGFDDKDIKRHYNLPAYRISEVSQTYKKTFEMLADGFSSEKIASQRSLSIQTIYSHIAFFIERGDLQVIDFVSQSTYEEIQEAIEIVGTERLADIKNLCNDEITYNDIKMVVADIKRQNAKEEEINDNDSEWYFVDTVPFTKTSKRFLSCDSRVVLSELGYYLEVNDEYIKLGDYSEGFSFDEGNIWIKKAVDKRGVRMVHDTQEDMHLIGYIREEESKIIFTNPDDDEFTITFDEE